MSCVPWLFVRETRALPLQDSIRSSIWFFTQILEKVYVQFQSFLEDPQYKDQVALQVAMIRTFGKVAPHAEPHFRDEGIRPSFLIYEVDWLYTVVFIFDLNMAYLAYECTARGVQSRREYSQTECPSAGNLWTSMGPCLLYPCNHLGVFFFSTWWGGSYPGSKFRISHFACLMLQCYNNYIFLIVSHEVSRNS